MARAERRAAIAGFAVLALLAAGADARADGLRPHEVLYRFSFHGISGGELKLTLTHGPEPGSWLYETRSYPSFLARLVVSPQSRERSWFKLRAASISASFSLSRCRSSA